VYLLAKQQRQQKQATAKSKQGSGSAYHREHASHVADYGANSVDPNANKA
jgi:hypothetical protein